MTTMDTDDLSTEVYQGIIMEAEKFSRDLTLQFGILSRHCKNEEEYLNMASDLISELQTYGEEELNDIFFGKLPDIELLKLTLNRIIKNIAQIREIPKDRRHYEF